MQSTERKQGLNMKEKTLRITAKFTEESPKIDFEIEGKFIPKLINMLIEGQELLRFQNVEKFKCSARLMKKEYLE